MSAGRNSRLGIVPFVLEGETYGRRQELGSVQGVLKQLLFSAGLNPPREIPSGVHTLSLSPQPVLCVHSVWQPAFSEHTTGRGLDSA